MPNAKAAIARNAFTIAESDLKGYLAHGHNKSGPADPAVAEEMQKEFTGLIRERLKGLITENNDKQIVHLLGRSAHRLQPGDIPPEIAQRPVVQDGIDLHVQSVLHNNRTGIRGKIEEIDKMVSLGLINKEETMQGPVKKWAKEVMKEYLNQLGVWPTNFANYLNGFLVEGILTEEDISQDTELCNHIKPQAKRAFESMLKGDPKRKEVTESFELFTKLGLLDPADAAEIDKKIKDHPFYGQD